MKRKNKIERNKLTGGFYSVVEKRREILLYWFVFYFW